MKQTLEQVLAALPKTTVLEPFYVGSDFVGLDLSQSNKALEAMDVSSSEILEHYINSHIKSNSAKIAYGGYLETRNIYQRSAYFNTATSENERNIHLGLDLWLAAGSPIYAPLDGVVHSFKNNTNHGDYGPTIILEHHIENRACYTLYGHLSMASIEHIKVGQVFKKGEAIATLGDAAVNGDYAPHLHFQIIKDLQGFVGDYPGVCSINELAFYRENCPDPELLLRLL